MEVVSHYNIRRAVEIYADARQFARWAVLGYLCIRFLLAAL
jgi:hypothetical protein